ncbi:unnamed protein product [Gadus morhua 'NCC']
MVDKVGTNTSIHSDTNKTSITSTESPTKDPCLGEDGRKLHDQLKFPRDWTNTSIHSFIIKENQQVIDSRYLDGTCCGSTELLVVHLCEVEESASCMLRLYMDMVTGTRYPSNTYVMW